MPQADGVDPRVVQEVRDFFIKLIQSLDDYDEVVATLKFVEERAHMMGDMYKLLGGNPNTKGTA